MRRYRAWWLVAAGAPTLVSCSSTSAYTSRATALPTAPVAAAATSSPVSPTPVATTTRAAATTAAARSTPARDDNPPGDIPDNQAFVTYADPSGAFSIKVPEGWAQGSGPDGVTFTDKYNSVAIRRVPEPAQPVAGSGSSQVQRSAGSALLTKTQADSAVNPVTGKVARLDVEQYTFWRNGLDVMITLSSPVGSDNVDPWRTITDSFHWSA